MRAWKLAHYPSRNFLQALGPPVREAAAVVRSVAVAYVTVLFAVFAAVDFIVIVCSTSSIGPAAVVTAITLTSLISPYGDST